MMSYIDMRRSLKYFIQLFLIVSPFIFTAGAVPASVNWESIKARYPDEMAIFLKYSEQVNIDFSGDSVLITSNIYRDMLHLNEQSNIFAKSRIYTSQFIRVSDINARTLVPYKKKYKTLRVTNFTESNDDLDVFYDDTKYISFIFPAVQAKARTLLNYKETITDPHFLTGFYFTSYAPIMEARYTIRHHKNIEVKARVINPDPQIRYEEHTEGDYKIMTWYMKDVPKRVSEKNAPSFQYIYPHVLPRITDYKDPDGHKVTLLSNTDELYKWYSGWIAHLDDDDQTELRELVNSLTKGISSRKEKIKKIFYWVQDHIKYIAFEEGMRGLIPHKASYVYNKRFGDCKDMASITVSMLRLAGVHAYYAWIGTRDLPYDYTDLPSPKVDNHMIAAYKEGDRFEFLDATGQYMPLDLPTAMIQGKEALIAIDKDHYTIRRVPVIPRKKNIMLDDYEYRIEDQSISGSGRLTLTGYVKIFNSYRLIKSKKESVDKYVKRLISRGNNKFSVSEYDIQNLENRDQPIEMNYKFFINDYFNKIGDEIYINLNLDKSFYNDLIDTAKRVLPIENDYKYTNEQNAVFYLPEEYEIEYLPENQSYKNDVFGFDIRYRAEADKIVVNKIFYVNYLILEPAQFKEWNEAIKRLSAAYRDVLILKHTN